MTTRSITLPLLSAAGFILAAAWPGEACAEDMFRVGVSPGLSFGVSFGVKTSFALGLDVRQSFATWYGPNSYEGNWAGVGVFAQATWLNFSAWRFAAGLHGGTQIISFLWGADARLAVESWREGCVGERAA